MVKLTLQRPSQNENFSHVFLWGLHNSNIKSWQNILRKVNCRPISFTNNKYKNSWQNINKLHIAMHKKEATFWPSKVYSRNASLIFKYQSLQFILKVKINNHMIIWRDVEKAFVQIQHLFFTRKKKKQNSWQSRN